MFNCVSSKLYLYADDAKKYGAVMNDDDAAQPQNDLDTRWNWNHGSLLKVDLSNIQRLTLT